MFSSARRGYVFVHASRGSESKPEALSVALDPITTEKLRCREDLERHLPALMNSRRKTVQAAHAEYWLLLWPFSYVLGWPAAIGDAIFRATALPYALAAPQGPQASYEEGLESFRAGRYAAAASQFERALAEYDHRLYPGPDAREAFATSTRVLFYLGLAYEQLRETDRSVLALTRFLTHATSEDEEAYRVAEERLAIKGRGLPPCTSQASISIPWNTR